MSFTVGHKLDSKERTDDVTSVQSLTFDELLLPDPVLMGLKKSGFFKPSPIQLKAIPLGRCGLDMVVQAKSGTGKTCVFSVIALEAVDEKSLSLQTIVLAPTREIALQIYGVISSIGQFIEGLNVAVFIGGTQVAKDRHRAKNCHIAIGSPGRMKQLIEMQILSVANVRLFVLDEADKLVEEGSFQSQINWIYSSLPPRKQMLALSATYPEALAAFLKRYMFQPQFVRLNPKDPSLLGIRQLYYKVVGAGLPHVLFEKKTETIIELLGSSSFQQALVFSNYHSRAQSLSEALNSCGWPSTFISGNMEQFLRIEAITKLKEFKCRVLISTDLTARGIDAYNVDLVINMDVPLDWETYMHRIGRAGRYGSKGIAVSLIGTEQEMADFSAIASQCNAPVSELTDLSDMQTSEAIQQKPLVHDPQENSRKPIETNGRKQDTPFISNGTNFEKRLTNGNTHRSWNRKQQSVKPTKNKTTKTNSSTEESQESSSNDQYDNGDKNSISGQKENQTPFEFPEIPSLPDLNQRCNVHRRNEHYRRMNLEQLTADLAHFQLHGDFAPPPTQSQDTEEIPRESNSTGDGLSRDEKPLEICNNNSNSSALREPHLVVTSSLSETMPPTPPSSSKKHAPVTASQNVGLNHNSSVGQKMASKNESQSDTRVKANQSFKEQRNPTVHDTRPKLSRRTSNTRPKLSRRQSSASSSSLSWTSDSSSDSDCSNNLPEKQHESSQAFKPAPSYPAGQMAGFGNHQLCSCYFCTSDRIYADYVQQKALAHARYCIDFAFS